MTRKDYRAIAETLNMILHQGGDHTTISRVAAILVAKFRASDAKFSSLPFLDAVFAGFAVDEATGKTCVKVERGRT